MKRNFVLLFAMLVVSGIVAGSAYAAVPMLLSHQGRLLDASDQPVTGTQDITFRIYETEMGGAPLWSEPHLDVPVDNGLFHVTLGGSVTISGDLLVTGGTLQTERWLEIVVEGEVLTPRMRLGSTPYAVGSSRVSGDIETLPGEVHISTIGGSTTGTIEAKTQQYTATGTFSDGTTESSVSSKAIRKNITVNLRNTDLTGVDGDQSSELATDSGGSELKLVSGPLTGMMGSTTATIRTGATSGGGGGGGGALQQAYTAIGTYSDGTNESSIDQVSNATGASSRWKGMSGSTTGTIRMAATPDSTVEVRDVTVNGELRTEMRTKQHPNGGTFNMRHMSGSTTGTIRMTATPDSADNEVSIVDTPTGASSKVKEKASKTKCSSNLRFMTPTDSADIDESCDGDGARSILSGMSGSTTGTIRMVATSDSAGSVCEWVQDDTPDGEKIYASLHCDSTGGSSVLAEDLDGDGFVDHEILDHVDVDLASSRWRGGMSGSTTGTIRMMATSDSAGNYLDHDADGDGFSEAKITVTVRDALGNPTAGMQVSADTDDDGVPDRTARHFVDALITESSISSAGSGPGALGSSVVSKIDATGPSIAIDEEGVQVHLMNGDGHVLRSSLGVVALDLNSDGRIGIDGAAHATNPVHHSSGAHLTVGGDWTNASDKNLKENFSKVDGEVLLEKIEELPITQWNYKNEAESITHIGPTAQDFQKAFGLGSNDKGISTIDPSGIALAAIKELIKQNQELVKANEELNRRVKALEKSQK